MHLLQLRRPYFLLIGSPRKSPFSISTPFSQVIWHSWKFTHTKNLLIEFIVNHCFLTVVGLFMLPVNFILPVSHNLPKSLSPSSPQTFMPIPNVPILLCKTSCQQNFMKASAFLSNSVYLCWTPSVYSQI